MPLTRSYKRGPTSAYSFATSSYLDRTNNASYNAPPLATPPKQEDLWMQSDLSLFEEYPSPPLAEFAYVSPPDEVTLGARCAGQSGCNSCITGCGLDGSLELSSIVADSHIAPKPSTSGAKIARPASIRSSSDSSIDAAAHYAAKPPPRRNVRGRTPHKLVERRYREAMNGQFDALKSKVPGLGEMDASLAVASGNDGHDEDLRLHDAQFKIPTKGAIIIGAVGYIDELTAEKNALSAQVARLASQVDGLQRLVNCNDCSVMKYFSGLQVR